MPADRLGPAPAQSVPLNRWFGRPELTEPGLRWAKPANHVQHGVARGGLLFMTEERLGFAPRGIDALFGARARSWELSAITDVYLRPSLRKLRVTITTAAGRQRFIVNDAAVVSVYKDLLALRAPQDAGDEPPPTPSEGAASP